MIIPTAEVPQPDDVTQLLYWVNERHKDQRIHILKGVCPVCRQEVTLGYSLQEGKSTINYLPIYLEYGCLNSMYLRHSTPPRSR